jgi:hypothetical protein
MLRYDAVSAADAARQLREWLLPSVPRREELPNLTAEQLNAFEAAVYTELEANRALGPVVIEMSHDRRIRRAAQTAGIDLDYRWPDVIFITFP